MLEFSYHFVRVCVVRKYWMVYFGITITGYSFFAIEQKIKQ